MAKILWIDDKAGDGTKKRLGFDGLIYFIEKNQHEVEIKSSTDSILAALNSDTQYDLIILDILFDKLNIKMDYHQFGGLDALEQLIKTRPQTPVIILSVMEQGKINEEAARRNIDLNNTVVKKILRKGDILPMALANIVESILTKNSVDPKEETYAAGNSN